MSRSIPSLLLWAALLPMACSKADGEAPAENAGGPMGGFQFPVTFVVAEPGEVAETVEVVGDVVSARSAALAFERGGRIAAVLADLGDEVAEGVVLARLDDAVLMAQRDAARAAAAAARVEADYALIELQRAQEMGDAVADSERDRWSAESQARAARVHEREAELHRLEALLVQGELRAPFPAVVIDRHVTLGSTAQPPAPAFDVVDLAHREVHLELPADYASLLALGAPVELRSDAVADLRVDARLDALVPSSDPATRTFRALVRLDDVMDPQRRLLPGMFVRARLVLRRAASETVVPVDSLLEGPQGTVLVTVAEPEAPAPGNGGSADPGSAAPVARFVPVRVLARDALRAAVAPLQPGDLASGARVVLTGAANVFPGAPLSPQPHPRPDADAAPH